MEMYFGNRVRACDVTERVPRSPRGSASIRSLLGLADTRAPGPAPTFTGSHVLLAFITISGSSFVGRQELARRSGLGEGAARTVLKKLKEKGYVDVIRSGCFLTRVGRQKARSIESSMSGLASVPRSDLTMGDHQAALALRNAGGRVRSGIEQRDSAIRIGASGATTYVVQSERFTIPGGSANCERDFPGPVWSVLRRDLSPRNNDVVILCGGHDEVSARLGALAAATTLL